MASTLSPYMNADGVYLPISGAYKAISSTAAYVTGTDGNDAIRTTGKGQTVALGNGDDTYILQSASDVVVENPGGGVDTVRSTFSHTLEANVENLTLEGTQATYGGGNNLNNIIIGGPAANETLDGGGGNDVLVAGTGATNFVETQGNGSDVIYGFKVATDDVRLGGYAFTNFAQVQGALTQFGVDTVLKLSSTESLTFRNTNVSSLKASNFQFGLDTSQLKMTFDDEFNSLSASTSSNTTWRTVYGNGGNGSLTNRSIHGETEIYVDPTYTGTLGTTALGLNPFSINNGILTITAKPITSATVASELFNQGYTSGLLTTKGSFSQEYGYFDVRAKMPSGQGFWPAFWLLPTNGSSPQEIDVFEQLSKDPNTVYSTVHTGQTGTATSQTATIHVDNASTTFHDYGVLWTADAITFYVDNVEVASEATPSDMHQPMYMLLNEATGGSWGGPTNGGTGAFQVDYVHAYALAGAAATTGATAAATTSAVAATSTSTTASGTSGMAIAAQLPSLVGTSASDKFTVSMKDLSATATTPQVQIFNFDGAGTTSKTDHDFLSLQGFSKGSTMTYLHGDTSDNRFGEYSIHDAASGHNYIIDIMSGNGAHLQSGGDFTFI